MRTEKLNQSINKSVYFHGCIPPKLPIDQLVQYSQFHRIVHPPEPLDSFMSFKQAMESYLCQRYSLLKVRNGC